MIVFAAFMYHHGGSQSYWCCSYLIVIHVQLKTDILKEAIDIFSAVTSSDEPIDLEKSSELSQPTNMPTNMLDILLNSIGGDKTTPDDQDNTATANM